MKKQIQKTGKAAVDAENQINMANYRQVEEFCVKAGEGGKYRDYDFYGSG